MQTYESTNQDGKEVNDVTAKIDRLTEELLTEARTALNLGVRQARRRIVLVTIKLDRLLGEVTP